MPNASVVKVGSQNSAKVEAVREILQDYDHLKGAQVSGADVSSDVSDQPKSLNETIQGAMNRARNAYRDCDYSVGIESGLMTVPNTKSGYLDVCACVIHDGKDFYVGLSSAWEFHDPVVFSTMFKENINMTQAVNKLGLTTNTNIGAENGAVSIATRGRLDRKEFTKQALRMALIHIDEHDFGSADKK